MEMMSHLEGAVVDSLYETCLISWHNALKPPLPNLAEPAAASPPPSFQNPSHDKIFRQGSALQSFVGRTQKSLGHSIAILEEGQQDLSAPDKKQQVDVTSRGTDAVLAEHNSWDPHYDPDVASEVLRSQTVLTPCKGESHRAVVTRHLSERNFGSPLSTSTLTHLRHDDSEGHYG